MRGLLWAFNTLGVINALTVMPPISKTAEHLPLAKKAMDFLDNSPDPFHVVQTAIDLLVGAGFEEVEDIEPNSEKIQPGRRGFAILYYHDHKTTPYTQYALKMLFSFAMFLQVGNTTLHETSRLLSLLLLVETTKQGLEGSK
mgnify:FL=1